MKAFVAELEALLVVVREKIKFLSEFEIVFKDWIAFNKPCSFDIETLIKRVYHITKNLDDGSKSKFETNRCLKKFYGEKALPEKLPSRAIRVFNQLI